MIATADSTIQAKAIALTVLEKLKEKKIRVYHNEGYEEGKWIVLDAGRFIMHLFLKDTRKFYNLEFLWADAPKTRPVRGRPAKGAATAAVGRPASNGVNRWG
jgi:ribosome-associated protein